MKTNVLALACFGFLLAVTSVSAGGRTPIQQPKLTAPNAHNSPDGPPSAGLSRVPPHIRETGSALVNPGPRVSINPQPLPPKTVTSNPQPPKQVSSNPQPSPAKSVTYPLLRPKYPYPHSCHQSSFCVWPNCWKYVCTVFPFSCCTNWFAAECCELVNGGVWGSSWNCVCADFPFYCSAN